MHLRVNPVDCVGHGLCAELLPELMRVDEWSYPIVNDGAVPPEVVEPARRAARVCRTLALLLDPDGI